MVFDGLLCFLLLIPACSKGHFSFLFFLLLLFVRSFFFFPTRAFVHNSYQARLLIFASTNTTTLTPLRELFLFLGLFCFPCWVSSPFTAKLVSYQIGQSCSFFLLLCVLGFVEKARTYMVTIGRWHVFGVACLKV